MSGRHPDLNKYNDDFLIHTFQIHHPAPTSTDEARCMQNAYTILRGQIEREDIEISESSTLHLILSVSEPMGAASKERVIDFYRYIRVFGEHVGWELLDYCMGDPKKCGALYCDVSVRNARVAQGCMKTLAPVKPRLPMTKTGLWRYR